VSWFPAAADMTIHDPVSRRVFTAALMMTPLLTKTAFAASLPTPVTRIDFDVSRKGSVAAIDFRIKRRRPYFIALQFNYAGHDDEYRVADLVRDKSPQHTGVTVPIQLQLLQLREDGSASTLIFNKSVITKDYYAHGFDKNQSNGNYCREILTTSLDPGAYRAEARTLNDSPAFAGTRSYLLIDYRGKY
jgi:hypothetical protein